MTELILATSFFIGLYYVFSELFVNVFCDDFDLPIMKFNIINTISTIAIMGMLFFTALELSKSYSEVNNVIIGQPKKVFMTNNIIGPDINQLDISLGVVRNGIGSVSTTDESIAVSKDMVEQIKVAIDSGYLLKLHTDTKRFSYNTPIVANELEIIR